MKKQNNKKFLQACDMGGSLYGRKRIAPQAKTANAAPGLQSNMLKSYKELYKSQANAMEKLFKRSR